MKQELVDKAKEYGIDHEEFDTDKDLEQAIKDHEASLANDGDNDPDVETLKKELDKWKKEAKKAFEDRDAAKKERRAVQKKIKELENSLGDNPSKEEYERLEEELDELKNFKKEMDEKQEEEERNKLSEIERIKLDMNKELEKLRKDYDKQVENLQSELEKRNADLEKTGKTVQELRKIKLANEIVNSASKNKAYNPKQIERILSNEFTYDEDIGKYVYYIRDDKGKVVDEKTVDERVTEFLQDEDNANLVESTKKPGTDHHDSPRYPDGNKKKNKKYNPEDESIKKKADEKGLTVDDYIHTLELRDERLAKIKGE
jgi:chromosome segregation ATPase